jgi:hypothetical protein
LKILPLRKRLRSTLDIALRKALIDEDEVILGGKLFQQSMQRLKKEDARRLVGARGLLMIGTVVELRKQRLA